MLFSFMFIIWKPVPVPGPATMEMKTMESDPVRWGRGSERFLYYLNSNFLAITKEGFWVYKPTNILWGKCAKKTYTVNAGPVPAALTGILYEYGSRKKVFFMVVPLRPLHTPPPS